MDQIVKDIKQGTVDKKIVDAAKQRGLIPKDAGGKGGGKAGGKAGGKGKGGSKGSTASSATQRRDIMALKARALADAYEETLIAIREAEAEAEAEAFADPDAEIEFYELDY